MREQLPTAEHDREHDGEHALEPDLARGRGQAMVLAAANRWGGSAGIVTPHDPRYMAVTGGNNTRWVATPRQVWLATSVRHVLQKTKARWDPRNVFRHAQSIEFEIRSDPAGLSEWVNVFSGS